MCQCGRGHQLRDSKTVLLLWGLLRWLVQQSWWRYQVILLSQVFFQRTRCAQARPCLPEQFWNLLALCFVLQYGPRWWLYVKYFIRSTRFGPSPALVWCSQSTIWWKLPTSTRTIWPTDPYYFLDFSIHTYTFIRPSYCIWHYTIQADLSFCPGNIRGQERFFFQCWSWSNQNSVQG